MHVLELIGIAAVIFVVWKLIKAVGKTSLHQSYHAGAAANLSLPDATAQYKSAKEDFISAFWTPGSAESDNIQSLLDRAVFLKDRINQLSGHENGSAFRAKHRAELIADANRYKETIVAAIEANEAPAQKHGYATFEEWLKQFKLAAGRVNDLLAEKDGGSLIDFMEQTPLRNGFSEGVDPTALGEQFGNQFDFAEFMSRTRT